MKPKIIILEGADGVGKSSLRFLISNYNGKYFILERFTPSIYAYGKLFKREVDMNYVKRIESALLEAFDVCAVFLHCSPEILYKRYKRGKHVFKFTESDLVKLQEWMIEFIVEISKIDWLCIDNSFRSPQITFELVKARYEL